MASFWRWRHANSDTPTRTGVEEGSRDETPCLQWPCFPIRSDGSLLHRCDPPTPTGPYAFFIASWWLANWGDQNAWSECFLERFCHRECGCGFVSWTVVSGVSIRGLRCDDLIKPHICYGFEVEEKRELKWLSPHQFWPHPPSPITPKRMEKKRRQKENKRREEIEWKKNGRDGKGKRKRRNGFSERKSPKKRSFAES